MRIGGSIALVVILAILLALVMSPSGDPYSFVVFQIVLGAFGVGSFALGWFARSPREGSAGDNPIS